MRLIYSSIFIALASLSIAQSDVYRAESERINDLIHTKLKVSFDLEKEQMPGEAWLTLTPHFYTTHTVNLDAKGMLIYEVALVDNGKNIPLKYNYDNENLNIDLGKNIKKGEQYQLYIKYVARPNEVTIGGSPAISDAKGLYFIDPRDEDPIKPTQIWTQGETESSSAWFPTIDKPNQKTTEEIYITVPNHFVTLSNGTLVTQTKNNDGTRTDYWKQSQKHAPYLFYMGIGDFAVVKDEWKGKPVNYYVEQEYAPYAKEIFGNTPEMLSFFSEKFGYEYPWDKYSQMIARDFVSGAMENTTAVIHMETANQKHGQLVDENIWEDVVTHELAHHWFGDLVTAESWSNLTVNESFANYSEYLWREHKYGKASADEHRLGEIDGYLYGNNFSKNLVRFHYDSKDDMFDGVSYNKGGAILHMLRSYLGDDAFFAGIKEYLHQNEFDKAEAHQLRLAFEKVSGKDLNWFFNQWYYSNGHPKIKTVVEKNNQSVELHIRQSQEPLFEFPLTVDVYVDGKPTRQTVWVEKKKVNTFKFNTNSKADMVFIDADNNLLAEIDQELTVAESVLLYKSAKDEYPSRKLALENLGRFQNLDDEAIETLVSALDDPYYSIRIEAINSLDISNPKTLKKVEDNLIKLATKDEKTLVQAAALNVLAELENKKYLPIFEKATKSESFSVQAIGIKGYMRLDEKGAMNLVKNLDDEVLVKSTEILSKMVPIWKESNDTSHFNALSEFAAFYNLYAVDNPEFSSPSKEAFEWIMSTDSPSATQKILSLQKQMYNQMKDQSSMVLPFLKPMIEHGLEIKKEAYKKNPSKSMKNQVESIEKVLNNL